MYTVDLNNYFPEAKKQTTITITIHRPIFKKFFTYLFNIICISKILDILDHR